MNSTRKFLLKLSFLLILQSIIYSTTCFSMHLPFLDEDDSQGQSLLQRDIKIPIGVAEDAVHYIILARRTPLTEISPKISRMREELGLSSHIPLDQQDKFFQDFYWQTTKDDIIKAPMSGRLIQLFVSVGQKIVKGDLLCEMEAMKMFHKVRASSSGEIKNVFIKLGEVVNSGSTLIRVLPASPDWKDINPTQIFENKDLLRSFFPWMPSSSTETSHAPTSPSSKDEGKNEKGAVLVENANNQPIKAPQEEPCNGSVFTSLLAVIPDWEDRNQTQILEHRNLPIPVCPWVAGSTAEPSLMPTDPAPNHNEFFQTRGEISMRAFHHPVGGEMRHGLEKPLTRPSVDLSHKGRGVHTPYPVFFLHQMKKDVLEEGAPLPLWERSTEGRVRGTIIYQSQWHKRVSSLRVERSHLDLLRLYYSVLNGTMAIPILEQSPSFSIAKTVLRGKVSNRLATESKLSLWEEAKWLVGFILLCKLIFALMIIWESNKFYLSIFFIKKIIYLNAIGYNKYRFITAVNTNHAQGFKRKLTPNYAFKSVVSP